MAQKKAHEVEAWLKRPAGAFPVILLYGPDRGLVSERARAFAAGTGLPLEDPFCVIRLDAGEADRDQGRLLDEAQTVPMFSDRRLLWVRNAGAQKNLAEDVKTLLKEPPRDALILIEAGELKKGAPLRSAVESSDSGMALPCYPDEERDLDAILDAALGKAGVSLALDARQLLRRNLGGDRLASRGEIDKLLLYIHPRLEITVDDVAATTGDVSALSVDDAVDSVLKGDLVEFDALFTRQSLSGSQVYQLLAAAIRQLQALHLLRGSMTGGRTAAAAVAGARPPVFFARRRIVENALERWSADALLRALGRLQTAVLATRRRPDLAVPIARQALLGIAVESARQARA